MSGQYWSPAAEGGYLYNDELSDVMRMTVQPLCKFRQFADFTEADKPLHRGESFYWNVASDLASRGGELSERDPIPETDMTFTQRSLTVTEAGNSIPYTGKLEMLAKQDLVAILEKGLKNNVAKYLDAAAYTAFDDALLRTTPTGGTSTTALTLDTDGTASVSNNIEMGIEHVKLISDTMRERNIPPYMDDYYVSISRPTTYRPFKDDLEAIKQYTDAGLQMIFKGEIGRYESIRFVEQTNIPAGGATDSTTFDAFTGTADAWDNAKSSWAFFFGAETVLECIVVPEELRAKIPSDYGRSKGMAWYYLGGFGIVFDDATNSQIMKWDSST
jgi:N4-gp56 family major capsid protein